MVFPLNHEKVNVCPAAPLVTDATIFPLSDAEQFVEGVGTALIAGNTWLFLISAVTGEEVHPNVVLVMVAV